MQHISPTCTTYPPCHTPVHSASTSPASPRSSFLSGHAFLDTAPLHRLLLAHLPRPPEDLLQQPQRRPAGGDGELRVQGEHHQAGDAVTLDLRGEGGGETARRGRGRGRGRRGEGEEGSKEEAVKGEERRGMGKPRGVLS